MTIRTRFTLLFSALVSVLLSILCLVIYFEADFHKNREFKDRLKKEALNSATLILNKDIITPEQFREMTKKQITVLNNEELVIFDDRNMPIYQSETTLLPKLDEDFLQKVRRNNEYYQPEIEQDLFGLKFKFKTHTYVAVIAAQDKYGISKQQNLKYMLILGWLAIILFSVIAGWYLAGKFLSPIKKIIQDIDKITGTDFSLRLKEGVKQDELEQLSMRFNEMLNRVENAFDNQRAFVSHVSHELRTPLTSITGQLQVSLLAKDRAKELKTTLFSVLEDIQQLNKLVNDLLELTSVKSYQNNLRYELVNVVHLIWQAQSELNKERKDYKVLFVYDEASDLLPEIYANESLLYTVVLNLIENGLKYASNQLVEVHLEQATGAISIHFKNNGNPIPKEELSLIFEPFRRGSNVGNTKGHGIGLPLVKRIVDLHKGELLVSSSIEQGTIFTLKLPT